MLRRPFSHHRKINQIMAFGIFSCYPIEGVKAKPGSMQNRINDFMKTAPAGAHSGKVRLSHVPMKLPMAAVLPKEGDATLCIGNSGMTIELNAGEIQWDGDAFSASRRNGGQGPIEITGTVIDGVVAMDVRLDESEIPIMNTKGMPPWKFETRKPRKR